jgi:hypothetical protein
LNGNASSEDEDEDAFTFNGDVDEIAMMINKKKHCFIVEILLL